MANNIKVAVRVRPLSNREKEKGGISIVDVNSDIVNLTNLKVDVNNPYGDSRERIKQFTFDFCYNSNSNVEYSDNGSQEQIFQDLGTEVIQSAVEGYNACLFAYGQTSTGKTYTMTGTEEEVGLIPRICEGLFSHVEASEDDKTTFKIEISYLEIYNERVRDLLKPGFINEKYTLKVREHPKDGPYVQDLSSHTVKNSSEIFNLLDTGNENRTTAATHMHEHSSRSHAIVTLVFTQALFEDDLPREIISKVHLVDLAGSERADTTSTLNYKSRLKEGANINKSLVTLGNVIKSLAERSLLRWTQMGSTQSVISGESGTPRDPSSPRRPQTLFIPYRDSVLTWLLRDSLGGNSKTIMISTITPASQYYNETLSTLRYAQRAKNIVNKPTINEDTNVALIRNLQEEIKRLRQELANAQLHGSMGDLFYLVPDRHSISHSSSESDLQAGLHVPMRDQGTVVERLQEKEIMAKKLTQSWKDKWSNPFQEGGFGYHELRRASSHGIILDSQILVPHLVGLDEDILSSGVVIYRLDAGRLYIGTIDADSPQDIELSGNGIEKEHCFIENDNGDVIIYPNPGCLCKINNIQISEPSPLRQGDVLTLGTNTTFRFNNPAEAARLREHRNEQTKRSLRDENTSTPTKDYLTVPLPIINRQSTQPFTMFNPRLESAEFCVELNNKYPKEADRIEQASQELNKLRGELREREEKLKLQEEELSSTHLKTKHELEEEKKKLADAVKEYQKKKSKVEELEKENAKLLAEDQKYLRKLEKEANQIQKTKDKDTSEDIDIIPEDLSAIRQRKRSVEGRLKDLAQQELVHKVSSIEKARSLALQEELLEEEEESIQVHQQKVRSQEQTIKVLGKSLQEEIKLRKREVGKLEAQEDQIKAYIQENKDLIKVAMDKPNPIRSGVSELDLHSKSTGNKKSISPLSHAKGSRLRHSSPIKDESSSDVSLDSPKSSSESIRRRQKSPTQSPPKSITSSAENVTSRLYRKYEVKHRNFLRKSSGHKLKNQPVRSTAKNRVPLTTPAPQIIHRSPKPIINDPLKIKKFGGSDSSLARPGLVRSKSLMRQIASMSNLASVPEASFEAESEAESMHSEPNIPIAVAKVRRRNKRTYLDEERSHSMPMDGNFEQAWDQYAKEQGLKNHAHYSDSSESDFSPSKDQKRRYSYQGVGMEDNDHEQCLSESTQTDLDLDLDIPDVSDSDTSNMLSVGVGVDEHELSAPLDDSVSIPDSLDGEEQSVEKTPRNEDDSRDPTNLEDSFRSDANPEYEGLWTRDEEVADGVENYVLCDNANKLEDSIESMETVIRQNVSERNLLGPSSHDSDGIMSEDSLCDSDEHMDSLESPNSGELSGKENYMLVSETNYPHSEIISSVRGRTTPEYTELNSNYSKNNVVPNDNADCAKRQKSSDSDPKDNNPSIPSKSSATNPKKHSLPLQYNDSESPSDSPSSSIDSPSYRDYVNTSEDCSSPSHVFSQQQQYIVSSTASHHSVPHTTRPSSSRSFQSDTDSSLPTTPIKVRYKVTSRKNRPPPPSSLSNPDLVDTVDSSASSPTGNGVLAIDSRELPSNSKVRPGGTKTETETELQCQVLNLSTETSTPSDNENISNVFNKRQDSVLGKSSTQGSEDNDEIQTQVLDMSSDKSTSECEKDPNNLPLSDQGTVAHPFDHSLSTDNIENSPDSKNGATKDCPEVIFVVKLKPNSNSSSDIVVLKPGVEYSVESTTQSKSADSSTVSDVNQTFMDHRVDDQIGMVPFLTPGTVYTPFLEPDGEVNHQQIRQELFDPEDETTSAADLSFPDSLPKDGVTFIETGFQKSNLKSNVKFDVKTRRNLKTSDDEGGANSDVSRGKDKSNTGTEYSDDSLADDNKDLKKSTASNINNDMNQVSESLGFNTSGNQALSSSSKIDHYGLLPRYSGNLTPDGTQLAVSGKQDEISSQMSQDSIGDTPLPIIGFKEPRDHSANSHSSTTNRRQRRRSQRPQKDFRSDDTDEFSDDSLASGSNSKPPSRPNSGKSGKRKRKPRNSEENRKGDITSDEYAHSANSSFSDDSLIFSIDRRGMQEPSDSTKLEIATINESIIQMNTALNRLPSSENYKLADGIMTMSPVSVWSSGDSGIQPYTDVSTCGVQTATSDNVSVMSPRRQSWNLSISKPEIWMNTPSDLDLHQTGNKAIGEQTGNHASTEQTRNKASGEQTRNKSSGGHTGNLVSGAQTGNLASGGHTGNLASGEQTGNQFSGGHTGNLASGEQIGNQFSGGHTGNLASGVQTGNQFSGGHTGNLASGVQTGNLAFGGHTGNLASGVQTGKLASGVHTGNLASGGQTGNLASAEQIGNLASGEQTGNLASDGQTGNLASGEQTGNLASGVQTGNLASGVQTGNIASGGQTGNLASGGQTGNLASAEQIGNLASGGQTGNLASDGQTGNLASGEQTGNLASGGQTGNLASDGQTGNLASGEQTGNIASGGQTGNLASGGQTGNLVSGGQTGNLASGEQTGNLASGVQTGNLASGVQTGNLASGVQTGNTASGGQTGNIASGGQTGNLASGVQTGNLASGEQTGNLASGVQTGNLASGEQTGNLASGVQTGNLASGGQTGNIASGGQTGNLASGVQTGNLASGGQTGNIASGGQTGNLASGGQTGNLASGVQTGNLASGEQTGNLASGVQTGNLASGEQTGNLASGVQTGNLASGGQTGNLASGGHTGNLASGEHTGNLASGVQTGNHASGVQTGNQAFCGHTTNLASGGQTGNLASGGQTGNLASGGHTGNLASGGQTGSLVSGVQTGNIASGEQTGNLASGVQTGNLAFGEHTGNLASVGHTGNLASGVKAGNLASGGQTGNLASGGQTGNLVSGVQTGNHASGVQTGNQAFGGHTGNLASGGQTGNLASGGHTGNLASGAYTGNLASGGHTGNLASGGHTGNHASGGHTGNHASGGHTGNHASGGHTGNHASGGHTGNCFSDEQIWNQASGRQTGYHGSIEQAGNCGSGELTWNQAYGEQTGNHGSSCGQTGNHASGQQTGNQVSGRQTGNHASGQQTGNHASHEENMAEIHSTSPTKVERLHQSSIEQDPDGKIKYLVTINEDETKILYNVEKTEYRTFSVGDETNPPISSVIPNTININLTETKTIQKKDNYEAREKEKILYHRGDLDLDSADAIVSSHFYQEGRSLQTEQNLIGDIVSRESSVDRQLIDSDDRSFIKPSSQIPQVQQEAIMQPIDVEHVLDTTLTDAEEQQSPELFVSSSVDVLHEAEYVTEDMEDQEIRQTESGRSIKSTGCSTAGLQEFASTSTDVDQLYSKTLDSCNPSQNIVTEALYFQDEITLSEQQLNGSKQKDDGSQKPTSEINQSDPAVHGSSVDNESDFASALQRNRSSQLALSPELNRMNLISPRSLEEELDDGYASINVTDGKLTSLAYHPDIGQYEVPLDSKSNNSNSRKTSLEGSLVLSLSKSSLKNTDDLNSTAISDDHPQPKQKSETENLCEDFDSTILPLDANPKDSPTEENIDSLSQSDNEHIINYSLHTSTATVPQDALISTSFNKQLAFDLSNKNVSASDESYHHKEDQFSISSKSFAMSDAFQHKEEGIKIESGISKYDEADGSHIHGYGKRVKAVMIGKRGVTGDLKTETRRPSLVFNSRTDQLTERRPSLVFDSRFDVYKKDDTSITVLAKPASLRIFLPESNLLKSSSDFLESPRLHSNDLMINNEELNEGLSPQQSLRIGGAFLNSDITDSSGLINTSSNQHLSTIYKDTMASCGHSHKSSRIEYSDVDSPQAALKIGQAFLGSTSVHSSVTRLASETNNQQARSMVDGAQKIIEFIHPISSHHTYQHASTGGLNELHQRTLMGGTNTSFHLTESDQSEIDDSGFHTHTTTDSSLSPDSEEQKSPRRINSSKSDSSSVYTHSVLIDLKSDYQTTSSDQNSNLPDSLTKEDEELRFDVQQIEFGDIHGNFYDEIDSVIDETVVVQTDIVNSNTLRSIGTRTDNSNTNNFRQFYDSCSEQTLISVDSRRLDTDSNQSKSSEFTSNSDIYLTPENGSTSNSSIYKTPEQSPRQRQASHINPTYSDGLPVSSTRFNKHQTVESSETVDSLKWELARRIAKLQSRYKSLSDSAISSDFTDVERSGSFRHITSRRSSGCGSGYVSRKELDRSLQEISLYLDNVPPQNLIDHSIHRSMEYTDIPNQLAQAMMESRPLGGSPPADNLANVLDSRRPARLYGRKWRSLGDLSELSGTEILRLLKADFDESLSRRSSSDDYYLPPDKDSNSASHKSQRYVSWGDIQCRSLEESNIEHDLVVTAASRTNQFNILLGECKTSMAMNSSDSPNSPLSADQLDFYLGNVHSSKDEHQPKRNSVDRGVNCRKDLLESNRRIRQKSPSMSDLEHGEPVVKDFEKAHSTGCVDILDSPIPSPASSNASSNDSITFVFVGNSEEKSDVTHSNPNMNQSSSSSSPQTTSRRGQSEGHLAIISHIFENKHLTRRPLSGMSDKISDRSASCDNISTQGNKELRRSYSTSLLDVVQIEEPEIEPFPPSGSNDDIIDGEDERGAEEEPMPKQELSSGLRRTITGQFGISGLSKQQLQNVTSLSNGESEHVFSKQESNIDSLTNTTVSNNKYHQKVILVNRLTQTDEELYGHHLDWQEYRHDQLDITSAELSDESGFITDANVYSPPSSFRDVSSNLHSASTIQNFSAYTNIDLPTVNQMVIEETIEFHKSSASSNKISSSTQTADSEIDKDILNRSNTETQTSPALSPIASPVTVKRTIQVQTEQENQTQSFTDGPTNTTILEEIADLRKEHTKMMALLERSKHKPSRPSQLDLFIKQKSVTSDSSGSVSPVTVIEKLASKQGSPRSRRTEEDTFDRLFSTTTTTTTTRNNREFNDDIDDLRLNIDLESLDSSFTNQNTKSAQPKESSSYRSRKDQRDSLVYVPIGDDNKRYFVTTALSPDHQPSQNEESHHRSESVQDQLDKLQQERIEIIDLLNLNYLPASLTVELLEAKLNHCIGQTDALLQSVDETWDDDLLSRPQPPIQNITEITKEYIDNYRKELKKSKRYYDVFKEEMERKVSKGRGRRMSRTTDLVKLSRKSQIEAFKLERQLEQERYQKIKLSNSRQPSPASSSSSFEPGYLTPRQRIDHLVGLRRNIVESSEEELSELRRRSVSPRFSDRSYSPDYYSLYSPSPSPRSMSLGNNPYENTVDPFPSLIYSPDVSFSGSIGVSPTPGFQTGSLNRLTPTVRTSASTSSNNQSDHLAYISLPYQDYMANQLDPSKLLQESAAVRSRNLQEISRAHSFLFNSRHLTDVPLRASSPVVRHPAEVREYSPQSPNYGITKMDIDRDIEQLRTIQKSSNYGNPSSVRCASPIGSDVSSTSSYAAYAKDILARSERSVQSPRSRMNSTFSGVTRTFSPRPSTPSSIYSADLESLTDSTTSSAVLSTRPVNARDIKARIARRKITERRNKKPSDKR